MIPFETIEEHFKTNKLKYTKWLARTSGSIENAEDILQETYYRALRYHEAGDPERIDQWMNRILTNCLIDLQNEEKGRGITIEVDEDTSVLECQFGVQSLEKEIYELINTKSLVQIEVLEMSLKFGYRAVDIAKITGYTYAQCHKIISRFREELKELYAS